jgi:hypothetical protein
MRRTRLPSNWRRAPVRWGYAVAMPREYLNAVGLLGGGVHALVGIGDIRQRLHKAYLYFQPLVPSNMPEHLREDLAQLKHDLTGVPVAKEGEGALVSTLRAMSDEEADRLAKKIYALYVEVVRASYEEEAD